MLLCTYICPNIYNDIFEYIFVSDAYATHLITQMYPALPSQERSIDFSAYDFDTIDMHQVYLELFLRIEDMLIWVREAVIVRYSFNLKPFLKSLNIEYK